MRTRLSGLLLATLLLTACGAAAPYAGGNVAELKLIDEQVGTGTVAGPGMDVTVHYTGWLYDEKAPGHPGEKFDSSRDKNPPFTFFPGGGQVIRGWDEGVEGMRVGGKRFLLIPAAKGYGDEGAGGVIPPGASLVFDVELLDAKPRL